MRLILILCANNITKKGVPIKNFTIRNCLMARIEPKEDPLLAFLSLSLKSHHQRNTTATTKADFGLLTIVDFYQVPRI